MTETIHQLWKNLRKSRLVRFSNRFEPSPRGGYILDVGSTFFLLAVVSDRIWFDGFACFRISDISNLEPDPYAAFVESALQKRGDQLPEKPEVDLGSIDRLVISASRAFPLITIHHEEFDPGVCWIGRVIGVERGSVVLLEISPDATWEKEPTEYLLSQITRVDFGGDYENALHLVGGDPGRGQFRA